MIKKIFFLARYNPNKLKQKIKELETDRFNLYRLLEAWTHDMNTPINAISAALSGLKNIKDSEDLIGVFEDIITGMRQLADLNDNIKEFSSKNPNHLKIELIEAGKWFTETVSLYKHLATARGINLTTAVAPIIPSIVRTDKLRVTRVLSNIISNAIRFTPQGRNIMTRLYVENKLLHIDILDEGSGIPNDKLFEIFEPYVRLNKMAPGCGLGLSIAKQDMNILGGEITVKSEIDKGSVFTFTIPNIMHQ